MKQYRMTYILRLLWALLLLPAGAVLLWEASEPGKNTSQLQTIALVFFGLLCWLTVALVWLFHGSKRVLLGEGRIELHSLFGTKTVHFDQNTKIYHQRVKAKEEEPDLLETISRLFQTADDEPDHAADYDIKIRIRDGTTRISLNGNVRDILQLRDQIDVLEDLLVRGPLQREYEQGQCLHFGAITLQQGVLMRGKKKFVLTQCLPLRVEEDQLIIRKIGPLKLPHKIKTAKIANLRSLLYLAQTHPPEKLVLISKKPS